MVTSERRPLRIVYVTAGFPYPLTSGFLRHYHFIRGLSERGHRITLLSLAKRSIADDHVAELRRFTEAVEVFPAHRGGRIERSLIRIGMPVPAQASRALADRVKTLVTSGRFDAVLLSGKETYPVLGATHGYPLAVDMCDATASRLDRAAAHARGPKRTVLRLAWRRMRTVERRLVEAAVVTAYASVRDREDTVGATGAGMIVPNGVDTDYWRRSTDRLGTSEIAFTGAMDYRANVDAAIQLIDEVLPRVRSEVPDASVAIIGRDPVAELVARAAAGRVTVTGEVDDIRPHLERSAAFAAPIRIGAGIQNKVLEAMAMGVPVVASPLAADGLRLLGGDAPPIAIARTADEMAAALIVLLRDAREDAAPHAAGREYVREHFAWSTSIDGIEQMLFAACERS